MKQFFDIDLLQFGITNICNNNCIMCHQSQEWYKETSKGYMKFEKAKEIIDDLYEKNIKFKVVHMFWKGEPFLNPHFLDILEYLLKKNQELLLFEKLYINTNGTVLDGKEEQLVNVLNISKDVQTTLNFSIDASSSGTYKSIRGSDYFENIERSLKKIILFREKNNYENPVILFQMVIQKLNYSEVDTFCEKWQYELSLYNKKADYIYYLKSIDKDTIFFRPLQPETKESRMLWMNVLEKYLPEEHKTINDIHIKRIHANKETRPKLPCFHLWDTPVIGWDGKITACCSDFYFEVLGENWEDLDLKSFSGIWYGKEMDELRRKSYFCDYDKMPDICRKCIMYLELSEEFKQKLESWALDRDLPVLYSSDPKYSSDVDDLVNIANKKIYGKNFREAYLLLNRVFEIDPENEKVQAAFLTYYSKTKQYDKGIILAQRLIDKTNKEKFIQEKAFFYERSNNYLNAFKLYKLLYKRSGKKFFIIKCIEMLHIIVDIDQISLLLRYLSIFKLDFNQSELNKIIDLFFLNKSFRKSKNAIKSYKNLLNIIFNSEVFISREFFYKVFYLKRELVDSGENEIFLKLIRKYSKDLEEKRLIELVEFEIKKYNNSDEYIFYLLNTYIKKNIYFVYNILEKLNISKERKFNLLKEMNVESNEDKSKVLSMFTRKNHQYIKLLFLKLKGL